MSNSGSLYIVATPIGNLDDITYRAVEILKSVNLIAAEDTRHSKILLEHYGIKTPLISFHDYSTEKRLQTLMTRLQSGEKIALISDAGTPLISDPGYELVYKIHQLGIEIVPIPGPCAAIAALSVSGLPTDRFIFEGFLPSKNQARLKRLEQLKEESRTLIFYESVHRIESFMESLVATFGETREAVIARELTKKFETIHRGALKYLLEQLRLHRDKQKGEFVIILQGKKKSEDDEVKIEYKKVLEILLSELSLKQAVDLTVRLTQGKRGELYELALKLKGKGE